MSSGLFLVFAFAVMLFCNVPIAFALGVGSLATMYFFNILPLTYMVQSAFQASDSFTLIAVPFFILAGDIMMHGGISTRLVNFCSTLLGHRTGGLGMITVLACLIFASISGSGPATVAAIGGIMIPHMISQKYDRSFSCTLAAAAGSLGPIIPPSIAFVMYGVVAGVSITDLFIAGIVPGIIMGLALMLVVFIVCKKYNYGIKREKAGAGERLKAFNDAKWALLIPVIILGGIYTGIFTPTEAAVITCDYAIIVSLFIYKEIRVKDLPKIFAKTALTTGTVMILVACATAFGKILTVEMIPIKLADAMLGLTTNKYVILLLINLILFITGMLMETLAAIVILAPLLLSIVTPLGISPLHFGIIMVVNLVIGQCTPPVGVNLYVAGRIGKIPIDRMFRWLIPLIGALLLVLMLFTYIPELSMFLLHLLR